MVHGDLVGVAIAKNEIALTPKQMADALIAAGAEPAFFSLNEAGEEISS